MSEKDDEFSYRVVLKVPKTATPEQRETLFAAFREWAEDAQGADENFNELVAQQLASTALTSMERAAASNAAAFALGCLEHDLTGLPEALPTSKETPMKELTVTVTLSYPATLEPALEQVVKNEFEDHVRAFCDSEEGGVYFHENARMTATARLNLSDQQYLDQTRGVQLTARTSDGTELS